MSGGGGGRGRRLSGRAAGGRVVVDAWWLTRVCVQVVDFYEYYEGLQEGWDGPALLVFSDGKQVCARRPTGRLGSPLGRLGAQRSWQSGTLSWAALRGSILGRGRGKGRAARAACAQVGARLDRNGLRPARFWRTKDDIIYVASEVGVLNDVMSNAPNVVAKGRLGPGQMVLADLTSGSFFGNAEVSRAAATRAPYKQWLAASLRPLSALGESTFLNEPTLDAATLLKLQAASGMGAEDAQMVVEAMAQVRRRCVWGRIRGEGGRGKGEGGVVSRRAWAPRPWRT